MVQVVLDEIDTGPARLATGLAQHSLGKIDCRHRGASGCQPNRMPARATAQVQDRLPAHVTDGASDAWLLQGSERVAIVIVDLRPLIVPVTYALKLVGFAFA